ncbi:MAG: ribosomal protein L22 [Alteromonas naphthalenivorans]|jgi:ribosomal protein L22
MKISTIILLSSLTSITIQAKMVRTVVVELVEEKINGQTFVYRLDVVDGRKKEQWSIDSRPIEHADYDRKILEAELKERSLEREQAYQKRVRLAEFKSNAASLVTKKLLVTTLQEIEQGISQFARHELTSYIAYSPHTFADEVDFATLRDHTLGEVRQVLESDFDPEQAKEKLYQIQAYPKKIASLFEGTVQNAINNCDEPKKLKQWLQMLS